MRSGDFLMLMAQRGDLAVRRVWRLAFGVRRLAFCHRASDFAIVLHARGRRGKKGVNRRNGDLRREASTPEYFGAG
jgi:hypothetical protein